jgi:hypothetical protein
MNSNYYKTHKTENRMMVQAEEEWRKRQLARAKERCECEN